MMMLACGGIQFLFSIQSIAIIYEVRGHKALAPIVLDRKNKKIKSKITTTRDMLRTRILP